MFCAPDLLRFYLSCGWEHVEGAVTRIGTPATCSTHPEQRLMRFISPHGVRHRASFTGEPLYIDWPR